MHAGALAALLLLAAPLMAADWTACEQPDLARQLAAAPELEVETLGVPVRSTRVGAMYLVPNPDGRSCDILQWYFRGYSGPTTCFVLDCGDGSLRTTGIPDRRQIHIAGNEIGPDGRLYLATPDWKQGMEIYVYDPASNELSCMGVVAPGLTGERRPLVTGTDGMIYGAGSHMETRKAGGYRLNPWTGEVDWFGPLGPSHAPEGVWGYYCGADDEWLYVASGKVPWYLVAYNHQTGEERVLLETSRVDGLVAVKQRHDGVECVAHKVLGEEQQRIEYWLYQGEAIPKVEGQAPPWPERPAPEPGPEKPDLYRDGLEPDAEGHAVLWYRNPWERPEEETEGAQPEDLGWHAVELDVPVYPMQIDRLTELPDGRLLGTCDAYLGNFVYDPATGEMEHLGKIHLSHYATTIADGLVYQSGYPSSPLYVYDPQQPWTANRGSFGSPAPPETDPASNPRLLVRMNRWARTHKMYGGATAASGRVYFGGKLVRNGHGGGLAWWDPDREDGGGLWEPFSAYQIEWLTAANEGTLIVASSKAVRDDLRPDFTPEQGRLFVINAESAEIVREIEPVPGQRDLGGIVEALPGMILGACADPETEGQWLLYGVDVASGEVLFRRPVPGSLRLDTGTNRHGRNEYRVGPDGNVWAYIGDVLVRIHPEDVRIEPLGGVSPPGRIAFAGEDVYLAATDELRVIRGIVGE